MAEQCQMCAEQRVRLLTLCAEVRATSALIDAEVEKPTMPWRKLLPVVQARLDAAADGAIGG